MFFLNPRRSRPSLPQPLPSFVPRLGQDGYVLSPSHSQILLRSHRVLVTSFFRHGWRRRSPRTRVQHRPHASSLEGSKARGQRGLLSLQREQIALVDTHFRSYIPHLTTHSFPTIQLLAVHARSFSPLCPSVCVCRVYVWTFSSL